jgi:hypothetical protein
VLLATVGITVGMSELLTGLIVLLAVAASVYAATKVQVNKRKQEIVEKVERVADVFSK